MPQPIELPGGRKIGPGEPCFVVAEIGQNHNGSVDMARQLQDEAVRAGCDAVKMCKRDIESDLTIEARDAPYVGRHSYGRTYGEHREALELPRRDYRHLAERYQSSPPITFFSTVCDIKSADQLHDYIDPPLYKIASRDIDNLPLINHVAKFGRPVILSTGMAYDGETETAIKNVWRHATPVIVLLCCSQYPAPDESVMPDWVAEASEAYGVLVGFSDHTVGIHMAQAFAQAGAVMVEKHVTLARAGKGTDHACSLEPDALRKMVRNIRAVESANCLPDKVKVDEAMRNKLSRSLVTKCPIAKGVIVGEEYLCLKSPGHGVHWPERDKIIGHHTNVDIPADTTILLSQVEE